jgi:hypothetical protein
MTQTWIGLRFTKEEFKNIFGFDVDNSTEEQFTKIEDYYLVNIDYDSDSVYLGEDLFDGETLDILSSIINHVFRIRDEIMDKYNIKVSSGFYTFSSSWR